MRPASGCEEKNTSTVFTFGFVRVHVRSIYINGPTQKLALVISLQDLTSTGVAAGDLKDGDDNGNGNRVVTENKDTFAHHA